MNTGLGPAGSLDPNWKVVSVPNSTTTFTAGSNAYIMTAHAPLWASSSSWPSKWIGVSIDGASNVPGGDYLFQLSFASASYNASASRVEVFFLVDNLLTSVAVSDGSSIIQNIAPSTRDDFKCFKDFTLTSFGPTVTILTFTVRNIGNIGSNPSGLLVQFGEYEYIANCPTPAPTC